MAAHAARICGHSVTIYSFKQKSPMEGAQYMHVEIPGIDLPEPATINYVLLGSSDGYREKVYGAGDPDIVVSPDQYSGSHKCWDLRSTYDALWQRWYSRIEHLMITPQRLARIAHVHDFVISTIDAQQICLDERHVFEYQPVWIDNTWSGPLPAEAPSLWKGSDNLVICSGQESDGWYRTSHIYGHTNTEWSSRNVVPAGRLNNLDLSHVWRVRKPLRTDCNCWPMVVRAGRYGLWKKGVLTHHAYEMAMQVLS